MADRYVHLALDFLYQHPGRDPAGAHRQMYTNTLGEHVASYGLRSNTALNIKGALEFLPGADGTFEMQKDWKEFGPRLGAAYRLGDRFAVRLF